MNAIGSTVLKSSFSRFTSTMAKVSLFIYLVLIFFGTSLPFQEENQDLADIQSSNKFNQIIFSTLYLISFISLLSKRHQIIPIVKKEKFLSLFLSWCFLSILWSNYPFVSFKRWIQTFGMIVIFLSGLLHLQSTEEIVDFIKIILLFYFLFSGIAILFIDEAIQWDHGNAWRGIAPHKNKLGQVSVVSLIIWAYALFEADLMRKIVAFLLCCMSLIFIFGASSATCILTVTVLIFLSVIWLVCNKIFQPVIGNFFSITICFFFFMGLFAIFFLSPEIVAEMTYTFGRDPTFSRRTDLWESVLAFTKERPIFGWGFGGFWVVNSPMTDIIFRDHIWLPNQAHMGYLDILNETGIVGISIFAVMILSYLKNLWKSTSPPFWIWLVIAALLINFSESMLFRTNEMIGDLLILCYLAYNVEWTKTMSTLKGSVQVTNKTVAFHLK
jgi:O-antigen ligase